MHQERKRKGLMFLGLDLGTGSAKAIVLDEVLGGMAIGAYSSDLDAGVPGVARNDVDVVDPDQDQEAYLRYTESYPRRTG
jgi:sugar (pentulose or hexulose) kinase